MSQMTASAEPKEGSMQNLIKEFMAQKRFAIVEATSNTKKYGYEDI